MRQCCLAAVMIAGSCAAEADEPAPIPVRLMAAGSGVLRARSQLMFDPVSRTLVRRWVQAWDLRPERNLVFAWTPDRIPAAGGPAQGEGRLTWRDAGAPSYDADATAIEYRGSVRDGRPEGRGIEFDRDGTSYEGRWRNGRPEGRGRLRLGDGAEYEGEFHAGCAEGSGRFIESDGEVFEGRFRKGLREGLATTVLPNHASYQSRWREGREDAASRRVRLAQASGGGGALDQDVRVGVSLVQRPPNDSPLQYASASAGEVLKVFPGSPRLMSLWKGSGELQVGRLVDLDATATYSGVFDLQKGDISPLQITLEAQNRSARPLQVVGAFLKVDASSTDYQPAVQLSSDSGSGCDGKGFYSPRFDLQNLGWGPVEHPVIRYAFQGADASPSSDLKQKKVLEGFQTVRSVDFETDLRALGVGVELLKHFDAERKHLPCQASQPADCLRDLKASGLFGRLADDVSLASGRQITIGLKGLLDYDWRDSYGSYQRRESPFTVQLLLGELPDPGECGEGADVVPVSVNPVELQLDRTDYRIPMAFERSLPPGRTARYSFALTAAKASRHRFSVVLQLADGREITSRPVDLTYFVPNWKLRN